MLVVTYSEARENFATILERTKTDGAVIVTRKDGSRFRIIPDSGSESPFADFKPLVSLPSGTALQTLEEVRSTSERRKKPTE